MTQKEKAKELVKKFEDLEWSEDISVGDAGHSNVEMWLPKEQAKQCSLICVEECIKIAPIDNFEDLNSPDGLSPEEVGLHLFVEYWKEVKQEIEKL